MRLGSIFSAVPATLADQPVTGFAIDHRKVAPGTVFGAFRGARFNGEDFIADAVEAGAIAVVASDQADVPSSVAHIVDDEPRRAFAQGAARYFRPVPSTVAAVTGTNGKTSTAEMTRQLWHMAGFGAASIGTLGVTTSFDQNRTGLTTPDIVTFLNNMSGMARQGISHVIFEASSHGLSQFRTEGLPVKIAAFTNFSRDHLDYHGTMEAYFAAKMRLFDEVVDSDGTAVIWADDPKSLEVQERCETRGLKTLSVGEAGDDIVLVSRTPTPLGQVLMVEHQGKTYRISLPLIGAYQAANALTSAGIAIAAGDEADQVFDHVARLQPVRGRLERAVIASNGAPVYVDYAHTPDALASAISALRPHVTGKLICVFGAGGDRDSGKRPEMGKIAQAHADHVIVTDDNPRGEDPSAIRAEILAAAPDAEDIGDRRSAIAHALSMAGSEDIVLLAGKGHEQGQIIGRGEDQRVLPFDDVEVARQVAGEAVA
ncbi:UDP-N-acetylmuramoyl-L-alanyl-D-glutamate--2,6-diaminopimelate ligase [Alterisphingorhabdus coralli]|uniref:UDP-N-acetylmuramoyl-L-alanyl-D-glutamate--2,6-diaminopimelate ligase n=1 Tax=Alterisphingorhabdus coralli TaxID=3071408 RepID=A0AA97FAH1_9SPHN|nr:UDP-N-acetylmuramoyl-L-alanyl-D-glutamate--2,6-diaminopimelate ligase [Parasphingorhabdus sp. SCSIO 66989]WOE76148.1 UDP-N-acetylmuramoyl-L-alanyl-D-glutamate--2,6-diaminopimelate ligase [Parasphingorhabdus sp. SCSIO 66989]